MEELTTDIVSHPCKNCFKEFRYKTDLDEHKICCEFLKQRTKERNTKLDRVDDNIPNPRMMYELIKHLAYKCERLEKQVQDLKSTARKNIKKIDILEYLTQNIKPVQTYKEWIKTLQINEEHLERTIQQNIIEGVKIALRDHINATTNELPLRAFSHKHNIFYIYIEENDKPATWICMTEEAIQILFDTISNKILKKYNLWEKSHPELSKETEDMQSKKTIYKQKILGNSICDETKYRKFTNWLFNAIKKNISCITEYEFS